MARWLREIEELEEQEETFDGLFVTKVFRVSQSTFEWLEDHASLAAVMAHPAGELAEFPTLSVEAEVYPDEGWNGWSWLHDELSMAGMNPEEFGL